ncbi:MAG: hypothetical protein KIT84_00170 [Labilithrix sp.]|nr:hypothetical protein [Labilithrix sp.]MCW5809397.1 hypothetical protein [Labilithrix sp.]
MRRDTLYYVVPVGETWIVRAIGSAPERFPTLEQALSAAETLTARGANVRVLSRPVAVATAAEA